MLRDPISAWLAWYYKAGKAYTYTYLLADCMLVLVRTAMRNERWESHAYGVAAERKVKQKKKPDRQKAKFLNERLA